MKKTKKNFRLILNIWYADSKYKNGTYGQQKRAYGDYLYSQDIDRFNLLYDIWDTKDNQRSFEDKG